MKSLVQDLTRATAIYADYISHRTLAPLYRFSRKRQPPRPETNLFPSLGLLFIHIPKAAGTSIRDYLLSINENAFRSGTSQSLQSHPSMDTKHLKAVEVRALLGKHAYDQYYSFSFVRNPWDLMASSYFWWHQKAIYFRAQMHNAATIRRLSFSEFIDSHWGRFFINEFHGQMNEWFQHENKDIVDYVGKVETLHADLRHILRANDIIVFDENVPEANKTHRPAYQSLYTEKSRKIVEDRFADIIERFDYTFD